MKNDDTELKIPLTPVENSSNITGHGYDPATRTLAIQFGGSNTYHYKDVPQEVANDLGIAASAADISTGKWINENIKGVFKYEKVG